MNDRKKILAWAFYDWGNSAYSTTVLAVILQTYLVSITPETAPLTGPALWSFGVFVSAVLSFLITPVLGAVADYANNKKRLWTAFMLLGSMSTLAMFTITPETYWWGVILTIVSSVGFSASFVFYNAFLPEIASEERRDAVSSLGWGLGYLGGGILLALNLVLILSAERFGLTTALASRISLASAGAWWLVFSLPMLRRIHDVPRPGAAGRPGNYLAIGFRQLARTLTEIRRMPQAFRFLVAFLLYNDGIQTVIALSATFGLVELKLKQSTLIGVVLMVQFVAFISAMLFARVAARLGAKRSIVLSLAIWIVIVVLAYLAVYQEWQFWALGAAVALVMGGSQALSRSLFAQMAPPDRTAELFSFYEISDKVSSIFGPLLFAIVIQATGSVRLAILALIVFFIAGLALLWRVDVAAGMADARREALRQDATRQPGGA